MVSLPSSLPDPKQLIKLARQDRKAAQELLSSLPIEQQMAVVCESPLASRSRILELCPMPEHVIPLLPEAEFCFTVKAVGLDDASWLVEHASQEQLVASTDLDTWAGLRPDHASMQSWLAIFAEAGDDTMLRAAHSIDPEFWVSHLRSQVWVSLKPNDDESWQPPEGGQTLDGQFYLVTNDPKDDLTACLMFLRVLFQNDYWLYFRVLQGSIWEIDSDLEEWALRWRTGRLEDMGFPPWDEAMQIYGFIRPEERGELPNEHQDFAAQGWHLPVWVPQLPAAHETVHAIFRAAAEFDPDQRRGFYYAFISLSNKVAVADQMPLGDFETLPKAIEKAAVLSSLGLEEVSREQGIATDEVLRRISLQRLFRVGANLDPEMAGTDRKRDLPGFEDEEEPLDD